MMPLFFVLKNTVWIFNRSAIFFNSAVFNVGTCRQTYRPKSKSAASDKHICITQERVENHENNWYNQKQMQNEIYVHNGKHWSFCILPQRQTATNASQRVARYFKITFWTIDNHFRSPFISLRNSYLAKLRMAINRVVIYCGANS